MARMFFKLFFAVLLVVALASSARAEVTAAQVNTAITNGVAFLEKQQQPAGNWTDLAAEPGGVTALCTLALLNCGRTPSDPSVKKALEYLERGQEPVRTYSSSLYIMAFVQADPKKYAAKIGRMARTLANLQVRDNDSKGGWSYERPQNRADNSNTQFAMLALHEAERAGVKLADQTWQLALNYWTKPGMQYPGGAFGYLPGQPATGSMTAAGIASLIIARDRLSSGDAKVDRSVRSTLERVEAAPGNRLACQARVVGDGVAVTRLLRAFADASAAQAPAEWSAPETTAAKEPA